MRPITHRRIGPVVATALALTVGLALPAAAAPGDQLWVGTYAGPGSDDYSYGVVVSADGQTVVTAGTSDQDASGTKTDIVTIAREAATGTVRWIRRINGAGDGTDRYRGLAVNPTQDAVYVTGSVQTAASAPYDWITRAYSLSTGAILWSRTFSGADGLDDTPSALVVGPGGQRVYVTGEQDWGSGGQSIRTIAYNANTGTTAWSRLVGDAGSNYTSTAIAIGPSGQRLFVAGGRQTATGQRAFAAAYGIEGNLLWTRTMNQAPELPPGSNSNDLFSAFGVSPDGVRVYGTGYASLTGSSGAILTAGLNAATGAPLWTVRNVPTGAVSAQSAATDRSLAIGPGGARIFVAASADTVANGWDIVTLALDATTGTTAWTRTIDGTAHDFDAPSAIAVRPSGDQVYMTGFVKNSVSQSDARTVAYSTASGNQIWSRSYNGPFNRNDYSRDIAVGPAGARVFVTGSRALATIPTTTTILTIAYTA